MATSIKAGFYEIGIDSVTITPLSYKDIKIIFALLIPNSLIYSTIVNCDNKSAIKLVKNLVFHARNEHIGIQHHFISNGSFDEDRGPILLHKITASIYADQVSS